MKRRNLIIALLAIGVVVFIFIALLVSAYTQLSKADKLVSQRWAPLEENLKVRYKLTPEVIGIMKKYAAKERDIFNLLTQAHIGFLKAKTINAKAAAANRVEKALGRLFLLAELYPSIKADEAYTRVINRLEATEGKVATPRMTYNQAVLNYNKTADTPPVSWFATLLGFDKEKVLIRGIAEVKGVPKKVKVKTLG